MKRYLGAIVGYGEYKQLKWWKFWQRMKVNQFNKIKFSITIPIKQIQLTAEVSYDAGKNIDRIKLVKRDLLTGETVTLYNGAFK